MFGGWVNNPLIAVFKIYLPVASVRVKGFGIDPGFGVIVSFQWGLEGHIRFGYPVARAPAMSTFQYI